MIRVFYYYYFLFYSKVLVQPEPHFVTVLAISFVESLWINAVLDIIALTGFCYKIDKLLMIAITLLLIAINYWNFTKKNNSANIIKSKPLFFKNHKLTTTIIIILSVIGISWLFWGSFYAKYVLENFQ